MASSDDEGDVVPKFVSDYEFIADNEESVSFTKLPIEWDGGNSRNGNGQKIYLSGKTDNGLLKIYKQVVAWKFDISCQSPEFLALSIDGHWIKLLKPRKAFLDVIRTIQITVHFLHFARLNPDQSIKALWDHLNKTFSMFERKPSEDDLEDHMSLINEAVKRDEALANSKILSTFIEEKPRKRRTVTEDLNPPFIVDDANVNEYEEGFPDIDEDEDDEDDCFDPVCAICDNGGHIYICEGKCLRAFHAKREDGEESNCATLKFTDAELEAIKNVPFYCKNCEHKKHQCFVCGKLGSSDESVGAEVFCCVNGACGHFYHPSCVAKLLHPGDSAAAKEQAESIAAGEQFTCPAHKCYVCKDLEVRSDPELQFAICRRCPRAYHRKCLPRDIAFESEEDDDETIQRAWEGLIPNRILIYCLKHEIDPDIATPVRDHIKFPGVEDNKKKKLTLESSRKKDQSKVRGSTSEDAANKKFSAKSTDKKSFGSKQSELSRKRVEKFPVLGSSKKPKVATNGNRGEISLGDKLYALHYGTDSQPERSGKVTSDGDPETQKVRTAANTTDSSFTLDADSRKRILNLMKDASASVTLEHVKQRHKTPSTHTQHSKSYVDNITMGKVEATVKAVHAALGKLNAGGNVQVAKEVCNHDLFMQLLKWKDKLKVYLSPFLYGMRYTSFGRHFTKVEKLQEIVDMLHWYIEDTDMLVDFCCGANDFSCLMKEKFDELGRKCSFKNYDFLVPKVDFCFEQRDWMGVRTNELPSGSRLIMGLNPPFGLNAALANKFIDKALDFKPKLIVLIVPRETQRLNEKQSPYDLILEDDQMFAGKTFYIPGSIDVNDKQMEDWNNNAPVFYLWSRPDWTARHKAIAEKHGHFPGAWKKKAPKLKDEPKPQNLEEIPDATMPVPKSSPETQNVVETVAVKVENRQLDEPQVPDGGQSLPVPPDDKKGVVLKDSHPREKNARKNSGGKRKRNRQIPTSPEFNSSAKRSASHHPSLSKGGRSPLEAREQEKPHHPSSSRGGRSSLEARERETPHHPSLNRAGRSSLERHSREREPHHPSSNKASRSPLEGPSREPHHPSLHIASRSPLEAHIASRSPLEGHSREPHLPSLHIASRSPLEAHIASRSPLEIHSREHEPHHPTAGHSLLEVHSPRVRDALSQPYPRRDSHQLFDQRNLPTPQHYHQIDSGVVGIGARRYSLNGEEPSSAISTRQAYAPTRTGYSVYSEESNRRAVATSLALYGEDPRSTVTNRQSYAPTRLTAADRLIGYAEERAGTYPYGTSSYVGEVVDAQYRLERSIYPPASYGAPAFVATEPGYVGGSTSAMQRYASRLNYPEPSHPQMSNVVRPPMHEATGIHDPYRGGSLGFAPAPPYRPFSQQNPGGGWVRD